MRHDPARLSFEIVARDGDARAGLLRTSHGPVETPCFVPLATRGSVKGLLPDEVSGIGYEIVLGNTYHLMLAPGSERIAGLGGLHGFMGWDRAIITDSGGFQVFSLAFGSVADEVKGRRGRPPLEGGVLDVGEDGVAFRSYIDGSEHFLSPERSMEVQAALGSDIALVFDECTPFRADYDYTARSTERTHRWLQRCLDWHGVGGPAGQAVFGIVQGGTHEDLRRQSAAAVAAAGVDGIAIGGTLGKDKEQMRGVVATTVGMLPADPARHLLGIGEPDDLVEGIGIGIDSFDCAVPTRLGRHGMALAPLPERRFRYDVRKRRNAEEPGPLVPGCPCPACVRFSRAYVHYLSRAEELTGVRLLTIHNLVYSRELVAGAREAIVAGRFGGYRDAIMAGAAPWEASV
ncbi:MAG TPA: tRNA guanosine(34) transglycosylase Tgt [Solirubrobacterales bacterium]|jgi:queuine tRNA-ribosyltransferase|nr:tRNA guanosine(34) transglycosylase Tgt [Solirubrobacterales bacterium]